MITEVCKDDFTANATTNFFRKKHKKHDKREPGLFKEPLFCTEMLCLFSKPFVVTTPVRTNTNSAAKV